MPMIGPGLGNQRAAADPQASVWVAANAGAGKTRVLVDRILRLMLRGTRPQAIFCLTFTKAAAAEMAKRLHQQLGEWATAADDALRQKLMDLAGRPVEEHELAPARRLFARTLDTPGGLQIQTIHAFCQSLLGRFPLEAGVPPHFQVMDERSALELLAAAREQVLEAATDGRDAGLADALRHVVALIDETAFAELLRELTDRRSRLKQVLRDHSGDLDAVIAATRTALGLRAGETEASLLAGACADAGFDRPALERAAAALDSGSDKDRERAEAIRAWLAAGPARPALYDQAYRQIFLTGEGAARAERGLATKTAKAADAEALPILLAEQARVLALEERRRAVRVADATAALWRLGAALVQAYETQKTLVALLDYDDLILKSRDLLRREGVAPWVLFKLDGGIDHILVDEAQDTSPEQWDVVAALAEEFFAGRGAREDIRTVFVVGDEKQSIFSFQGADPAEFARMRQHFAARVTAAGEDWREVDLALSFRSTAMVLQAVDAVFSQPAAAAGVTAATRPVHHLPFRRGQAGLVELWPVIKPAPVPTREPWSVPLDHVAESSPPAKLARRIALTISGWLQSGEMLASHGRPVRPGDIMILVRRRDAFVPEMVRALKLLEVPVAGTDRMVLTEQIAVMDLIALGHFVLLPEDDLTFAVVLKSPLFGFTDDLLFELAHGRDGGLWRALEARRAERAEFAAAHDSLKSLLAAADFTPPFEFYARLLGEGRGRARLIARLGHDAGDPIDEFLAQALAYERGHVASLQGFLHWLEAGAAEIKRDLEQGRDAVRVMTVHGAKGLEANIVFLPDTCRAPDGRHDPKLLWQAEAEAPLFFWPVRRENDEALCRAARAAVQQRQAAEYRRLLYVAMTRARDRLYICGHESDRGRSEGCWYDLMAPALMPLSATVDLGFGEPGWRLSDAQTAAVEADRQIVTTVSDAPLPAWAVRPAPAEPTPPLPLAPSRPQGEEPAVRSPLGPDDGQRFRRGRLIHRLLQTLPDLAPSARAAAAASFLGRPTHGLDAGAQAAIAGEVLALFDHPLCAGLFGPESQAEVQIAGVLGDRVISGQIDRLVVTDTKVIVVDYKSNRPPPQRPEDVPPIYLRQMAAYCSALSRIYPGRSLEAILIWTDGPLVMSLSLPLLQAWAP